MNVGNEKNRSEETDTPSAEFTSNTSTDESPSFQRPELSMRKMLPSLGPRRISLRAGAKVHMHSENNHT
jgi:hypothetical protein